MLMRVFSPNKEHRRTAIRGLSVCRYRSLENVVLEDLPPLIVLYGPNGSGKSNLLRAVQLALRAAALPELLPIRRQDAMTLQLQEADQRLHLRPDDFRFGDLPEIRIGLKIDLGPRAHAIALLPEDIRPARLELEAVFQMDGTKAIRFWFERALLDGKTWGLRDEEGAERALRDQAVGLQQNRSLEAQGLQSFFAMERIQRVLLPRLVQTSDAYRVPGAGDDPQSALYAAFLSEDPIEREAAHRFGRRLARAGLFGNNYHDDIPLIPVDSRTYGEKQIRFRHPSHGELSLRNLGSGEQQLVLMLAQRVITPFPITHLEEPEAHLHVTLMEKLAPLLRESVLGNGAAPDVDQLWMATHHHLFALSDEFFDVSLSDRGSTSVVLRKRDEAVKHFYEPSPYWDTLRGLVESGLDPETVVSVDEQGNPVNAQQILTSIQGDRKLANQFVKAATEAFILSLAKDGPAR